VQLLTSNFTGSLGPGAGQVRWEGSGGFAAQGADRTVRLNNSTAAIDWDAEYFVGEDNTLILGAANANGTLLWDTGLNINVDEARIRVVNGTAAVTRAEAVIQQAIEGWGNLVVEGDGRLDITANNPSFTGEILISGAELRLNRAGRFGAVSNIRIEAGGTLTLDNRGTHTGPAGGQYVANRLNTEDDARLDLAHGTLRHIGRSNANSKVTLPEIELSEGHNVIDIINPNAARYTEAEAKLSRALNASSTVNFMSSSGNGVLNSGGNNPRFKLSNAITSFLAGLAGNGSIIPWATVDGFNWAAVSGSHIVPFNHYDDFATQWLPDKNIYIYGDDWNHPSKKVVEAKVINSLKIDQGDLSIYGSNGKLTINSGGIIKGNSDKYAIIQAYLLTGNGKLTTPPGVPLLLHNSSSGILVVKGWISVINAGIIKAGTGIVRFEEGYGQTISGPSFVNEGILELGMNGGNSTLGTMTVQTGTILIIYQFRGVPSHTSLNVKLNGIYSTPENAPVVEMIASSSGTSHSMNLLEVDGRGILNFAVGSTLRLDDLIINPYENTELRIKGWDEFEDYLLVRKTSANLSSALTYINFDGWANGAEIRDYDTDYWEIIPRLPEPSTYGAIFGVMGLGLWAWRRRVRNASAATRAGGSQH